MIQEQVPIFVDSVKSADGLHLTRCSYFSIECTLPSNEWTLELSDGSIPFLLIGLSGIILSPINGSRFESIEQVEELFDSIESREGLLVDSQELWVPTMVFDRRPERGVVYRAPLKTFAQAIRYTSSSISLEEYFENVKELGEDGTVRFSEVETTVFKSWEESIIEDAIASYPKDEELKLRYDGDDDHDPPGVGIDTPPKSPLGDGPGQNQGNPDLLSHYQKSQNQQQRGMTR